MVLTQRIKFDFDPSMILGHGLTGLGWGRIQACRYRLTSGLASRFCMYRYACRWLAAMLVGLSAYQASAVVITGGDGSGNTTADSIQSLHPDFVWLPHVGQVTSGSGVYLGNDWAITAVHITGTDSLGDPRPPGNLILNGTPHPRDTSVDPVRLVNPSNGTPADLVLYKLLPSAALDAMPPVTLPTSTPDIGTEVVMIGVGRDREPDLMAWTTQPIAGSDERQWLPVPTTNPTREFTGYQWVDDATARTLRWGTNTISDNHLNNPGEMIFVNTDSPFGTIFGLETIFNAGVSDNEAQPAIGDSGGAMFAKNNGTGQWELVGIINSVEVFTSQPEIAVFGNATRSVDLAPFHDQIQEIIPEPSSAGVLAGLVLIGAARRRPKR